MAELATLARPYAEALFKSISSSDHQPVVDQLTALAHVVVDPGLLAFAGNPRATVDQVYGVIVGSTRTELDHRIQNLLRVVIENDRLVALPEVVSQFQTLVNAHAGSADATVYSAFPIEQSDLGALIETLQKRFDRKLKAHVVLAPELIGGIRVVVGDEVLDTSVKARLEQMKLTLTA